MLFLTLNHNNVQVISTDLLALRTSTISGDTGFQNQGFAGSKVFFKGLAIRLMFQNYTSQPTVYYRLMVVQLPRGETVSTANLFEGIHTNKNIDFVDTQRYKVVYSKSFKITHPNQGVYAGESTGIGGEYIEAAGGTDERMIQPGQKIVKFFLPVKKSVTFLDYAERQTIDNEDNCQIPKLHWQLVVYPYCPFGTPGS